MGSTHYSSISRLDWDGPPGPAGSFDVLGIDTTRPTQMALEMTRITRLGT